MAVYRTAALARAAAAKASPTSVAPDPQRFVAGRLGFGGTPPTGAAKSTTDIDGWFADQVALGAQYAGYSGVAGLTDALPCLSLDPPTTRQWLKTVMGNEWVLEACQQLEDATLLLQAWSPAQLYEATVDFFANQLNIANFAPSTWCARVDFDRTVVRANAFGKYRDMLLASAKHPAMLIYLDNAYSFKASPNENYGRELLEMHTVGSSAGYTQADVVDSARLMTGRLVEFSRTVYIYNMNQRWVGPVSVLGFSDPNTDARAGEAIGDRYLSYLAGHPSTASNLARKLCVRFVSDNPSSALVATVAQAYLDNDTAIVPMLQTILHSKEFWASAGRKMRRPYENVVATLRAVGAQPGPDLRATGDTLSAVAGAVGQRPLCWSPPNGYPDVATAWQTAGSIAEQWRFQANLLNGGFAATISTPSAVDLVAGAESGTVADALDAMTRRLLARKVTSQEVQALCAYLGDTPTAPYTSSSLPAHTADVGAVLLHGPSHTVR